MKRNASLQGLSRDHHTDLSFANRLTRWASNDSPPEELESLARARWAALQQHFTFEEQTLLPLQPEAAGLWEMAQRIRQDHADLALAFRQLLALLEPPTSSPRRPGALRETMLLLAHALSAHIRFEERTWFPALQQVLGAEQLARAGAAWELEVLIRPDATAAPAHPQRKH